jgi:hypothetical protein
MMPAGKYYVGDLCYVMHDVWSQVCDLIIQDDQCLDGEFNLRSGTRFAIQSTAYGDGTYQDDDGFSYPVDAGSIGCIKMDDINFSDISNDITGGRVYEFARPFTIRYDMGTIMFVEQHEHEEVCILAIETD